MWGRVGATGAAATDWRSDTSVVCKVAAGGDGSMTVGMSVGERGGSLSGGATYDTGVGWGAGVSNGGTTGGGSATVSGADFGTSRLF